MYDTIGNLIDYKRYDWTKKLSDWYQYKFDNKRIIEKKELDSLNNMKQKYNYKYELNENTHKIQEFLNDKLITTSIYKDSLLIEKHRIYNNEKVYYKYLFDKHNNWVKMLYFSNNKEYTHLTERKITYE